MAAKFETREAWLKAAAERLAKVVGKAAELTPPTFHVSVGFPKGSTGKGRARSETSCFLT